MNYDILSVEIIELLNIRFRIMVRIRDGVSVKSIYNTNRNSFQTLLVLLLVLCYNSDYIIIKLIIQSPAHPTIM